MNCLLQPSTKQASISSAITEETIQRKHWHIEISNSSRCPKCTTDKIQIRGSLTTTGGVNLVCVYLFWFIAFIQFLLLSLMASPTPFYSWQQPIHPLPPPPPVSSIISRIACLFMSPTNWIHLGTVTIKTTHAPRQRLCLIIPLLLKGGQS